MFIEIDLGKDITPDDFLKDTVNRPFIKFIALITFNNNGPISNKIIYGSPIIDFINTSVLINIERR